MKSRPDPEVILKETKKLRALARSLVQDEHIADDLVQDTWVVALEKPPRHREHSHFWLKRVLRNLVVDRRREVSSRRRRERAAAVPEIGDASTQESLERFEILRRIVELVWELEEREAIFSRPAISRRNNASSLPLPRSRKCQFRRVVAASRAAAMIVNCPLALCASIPTCPIRILSL